jgi:hypothetical protein
MSEDKPKEDKTLTIEEYMKRVESANGYVRPQSKRKNRDTE